MARFDVFKELWKRASDWLFPQKQDPVPPPTPQANEFMGADASTDTAELFPSASVPEPPQYRSLSPFPMAAGTPHLANLGQTEMQQPSNPIRNVDQSEDPLSRHERLSNERRAQQDARIDIRSARKAGDADRANELRLEEIQRRAMANGHTVVMPDEFSEDAPSPFEWTPEEKAASVRAPTAPDFPGAPGMGGLKVPRERLQEIQQQAQQVMPQPMFGNTAPAPSNTGPNEMLEVLKRMAQSLENIDSKLPQKATYED